MRPFRPAWWLVNPHLQTLWAGLLGRPKLPETRHERLELSDGDFLDLNWLDASSEEAPLVLIFHGLQGSIRSPYVGRTLNALKERGLRALFVHFRSCSGEPNRLARGYHAGDTGDIAEVINMARARNPRTRLGAMGFSLGGNALLKHLGEAGQAALIQAAVAVSVPYDLSACSSRLNGGFSRVYRGWLLGMIFRSVRTKRALLEEAGVDVDAVIASKTLRELDERLIAPLHDFEDADDYYARSSCRPFVKEITCPTLLIQGIDDPFLRPGIVPEESECGPWVERHFSPRGGHVGFLEGGFPGCAKPYYAGPPIDWLASKLKA